MAATKRFGVGIGAFLLFFACVVNSATISPTQNVEVSFGQLARALPTANSLGITIASTGNSVDPLSLILYDGSTLLGQATSGPVPEFGFPGNRWFDFISVTNPFDIPSATKIDFSSIHDGTFDFRIVLSSSSGVFNLYAGFGLAPYVSEAGFSQTTGEWEFGFIGMSLDHYYFSSAIVTELPVVVPLPSSLLLISSGLLVLLQRSKRGLSGWAACAAP